MRTENINPAHAWRPDSAVAASFKGGYRTCRIHGAARLVRILSHTGMAPEGFFRNANRQDGEFWFAEDDFARVKRAALDDLRTQDGHNPSREMERLRMYLRHQFRDMLAICRDWTPNFDYIARLVVPQGKSVISLVGTVKEQPTYEKPLPGDEAGSREQIILQGGLTQYVINFDFSANKDMRRHITGPFGL